MHHLSQLQNFSCAPQHAACSQLPSPRRSGASCHYHAARPGASGAHRIDHLPSAFLPPPDLASSHAPAGLTLPQSSNASGGGSGGGGGGGPPGRNGSPPLAAHFLPPVPLRPHPPPTAPVPARSPSGGAPISPNIMHTAASASLSPRSSASTSLYATHATLASNPSCESPHSSGQWPAGMPGAAGRPHARNLHWSSSAPMHVPPQRLNGHPGHSPPLPHLHAPAYGTPVSPRRSEEIAAACAAGLAQLHCGGGPAPPQQVAPMPQLRMPGETHDAAPAEWAYPEWVPQEQFAKRGPTSRQSSKRSDLTVSSIEGSTTAASLCAFEAPASHRGAASTFTTSPDWANPIFMSSTSMDTMGVDSEATGMMTTHTTTGTTTTHTLMSSPRAHRVQQAFPRKSHAGGAGGGRAPPGPPAMLAHAPGPSGPPGPEPLNLSAVAAVAGAAARQRFEWEALADTHSRSMHGNQPSRAYRRSSSTGGRRRHGGGRGGGERHGGRRDSGRVRATGVRGSGWEAARPADRSQRPGQSEIMPAEPRQSAHTHETRTSQPSSQVPPVDVPACIMWEAPRR